jgi:hypothetical protein
MRGVIAPLLDQLTDSFGLKIEWSVSSAAATSLDARALEHLVVGLVLDAGDAPSIELTIRERPINGAPWIEIVRGLASERQRGSPGELPDDATSESATHATSQATTHASESTTAAMNDGFDLKLVEVIATRAGGELAHSDRRGGGTEVVVALPVV